MSISTRQHRILELLRSNPDITVYELARLLSVSEPTIRRDFTELAQKGFIEKFYGGARLLKGAADSEIPFLIRENEKSKAKVEMGRKAAELVEDGMVLMLDGSTSAYNIVPYLADRKDLIVITSLLYRRPDDHPLLFLCGRTGRKLCPEHQCRSPVFLLPGHDSGRPHDRCCD